MDALRPSEVPDALKQFVDHDVVYIRFMDKVSSKKKRQRRVVAISGSNIVLADPKNGSVKRFFTSADISGVSWQDVPAQKGAERHVVFQVSGEHDLALSQVDDRRNASYAHATDPELVDKIAAWVKATTGRDIPVVKVPIQRDIIAESDRARKPGYDEKRDRQFKEIHEAAKRRRAERQQQQQQQQQQPPPPPPAAAPAAPIPTPQLHPATPTTEASVRAESELAPPMSQYPSHGTAQGVPQESVVGNDSAAFQGASRQQSSVGAGEVVAAVASEIMTQSGVGRPPSSRGVGGGGGGGGTPHRSQQYSFSHPGSSSPTPQVVASPVRHSVALSAWNESPRVLPAPVQPYVAKHDVALSPLSVASERKVVHPTPQELLNPVMERLHAQQLNMMQMHETMLEQQNQARVQMEQLRRQQEAQQEQISMNDRNVSTAAETRIQELEGQLQRLTTVMAQMHQELEQAKREPPQQIIAPPLSPAYEQHHHHHHMHMSPTPPSPLPLPYQPSPSPRSYGTTSMGDPYVSHLQAAGHTVLPLAAVREEVVDGRLPEAQVIPAGKYVGPFPMNSPVTVTHDEGGNTQVHVASPGRQYVATPGRHEATPVNVPMGMESVPEGVVLHQTAPPESPPLSPRERGVLRGSPAVSLMPKETGGGGGVPVVLETPTKQMEEYLQKLCLEASQRVVQGQGFPEVQGMEEVQMQLPMQGQGQGQEQLHVAQEVQEQVPEMQGDIVQVHPTPSHAHSTPPRVVQHYESHGGVSLEDSLPSKMLSEDFANAPSYPHTAQPQHPSVTQMDGVPTHPVTSTPYIGASPLDEALRRAQQTTTTTKASRIANAGRQQTAQLVAMSPGVGRTPVPQSVAVPQGFESPPPVVPSVAPQARTPQLAFPQHNTFEQEQQQQQSTVLAQLAKLQQIQSLQTPWGGSFAPSMSSPPRASTIVHGNVHGNVVHPATDGIRAGAEELQHQIAATHSEMKDFLSAEMSKLSVAIQQSQAPSHRQSVPMPRQTPGPTPGVASLPLSGRAVWDVSPQPAYTPQPRAAVVEGARLFKESLADIEKADRAMHFAEALSVLSMDALLTVLNDFVPTHLKHNLEHNWRSIITQYQTKARERLHAREQALASQLYQQQARGGLGGVGGGVPGWTHEKGSSPQRPRGGAPLSFMGAHMG